MRFFVRRVPRPYVRAPGRLPFVDFGAPLVVLLIDFVRWAAKDAGDPLIAAAEAEMKKGVGFLRRESAHAANSLEISTRHGCQLALAIGAVEIRADRPFRNRCINHTLEGV